MQVTAIDVFTSYLQSKKTLCYNKKDATQLHSWYSFPSPSVLNALFQHTNSILSRVTSMRMVNFWTAANPFSRAITHVSTCWARGQDSQSIILQGNRIKILKKPNMPLTLISTKKIITLLYYLATCFSIGLTINNAEVSGIW